MSLITGVKIKSHGIYFRDLNHLRILIYTEHVRKIMFLSARGVEVTKHKKDPRTRLDYVID